ncbi:MAG: hypothetical protein IPP64_13425 [Bacteroidetes bacterium]|nr:hypothetical protein [Bacteroidota bacterium]
MRNYLYIILVVITFNNLSAQEVPLETQLEQSVLNDYELTDKQYSAWKSIKNNWMATEYEAIQAENKIKLNCKNCQTFYVEVVIKINANGKLEYYKLLNGKRCSVGLTKELELRVMRKFFKFEYPFELRNTTFKTRLGNALKC